MYVNTQQRAPFPISKILSLLLDIVLPNYIVFLRFTSSRIAHTLHLFAEPIQSLYNTQILQLGLGKKKQGRAMSRKPMATISSFPAHPPTTFLSLPGEIRNGVYKLALTTSKQNILRPKHELEYRENQFRRTERAIVTLIDTSLLGVNKQIGREAASVFYGHHNFHYSIERRGAKEPPARLVKYIAIIRHLSVSYTASYPRSNRAEGIDNVIAQHIEYITEKCTQLCTLNFHILANQLENEAFESVLKAGDTSEKLRLLFPRLQRLSVVTFGPSEALKEFREGISTHPIYPGAVPRACPPLCEGKGHWDGFDPEHLNFAPASQHYQQPVAAHWTSHITDSWPQLSISPWEDSGILKRRHSGQMLTWAWRRVYLDEKIRVWHLRIPEYRNSENP